MISLKIINISNLINIGGILFSSTHQFIFHLFWIIVGAVPGAEEGIIIKRGTTSFIDELLIVANSQ